jgi:UDP-glucose 4-epimerase
MSDRRSNPCDRRSNPCGKTILVTGGCGFIASHMIVELLNSGYDVISVDNLVNSSTEANNAIYQITGMEHIFIELDVRDKNLLREVFTKNKIDSVIHFAGLKAVAESVIKPLDYYRNNLDSTLSLLEIMQEFGVKNLIFSSSASVYGNTNTNNETVGEMTPCNPINPYATTKYMIECILCDLVKSDPDWHVIVLRYFNPCGSHASGLLLENPKQLATNLMPIMIRCSFGTTKNLANHNEMEVYGSDYDTIDGTCIRDYIHVVDLVKGHIAALNKLHLYQYEIFNLGTGSGYSVLQMIKCFETTNNVKLNYKLGPRRPGDVAKLVANPNKAHELLEWIAEKTLEDMCRDSVGITREPHNPERIE